MRYRTTKVRLSRRRLIIMFMLVFRIFLFHSVSFLL